MAKDVKFLIKANAEKAESEIRKLQRTGTDAASILEREFNQLGIKSGQAINQKRKSIEAAYNKIKNSGVASAKEIRRAERAKNQAIEALDRDHFKKRQGFLGNLKGSHLAATAAIAAAWAAVDFGSRSLKQFEDFETALVDMTKVTDEPLDQIKEKIMALPDELGSATDLVKGYYQVISAGVTEPKAALDLLTVASKASKAAHLEQETTIKALTKLMAGFSGQVKDAAEASDLLFGIEKFGQTQFSELAPVIGDLASLSNQLKVIPAEMGGALAVLTQTAGSTSQAATQFEAILTGFIKPTAKMSEVLQQLGYDSSQALISDHGLTGALRMVGEEARKSFGPQGLGKVFESKEAIAGLGPLFADNFGQANEVIGQLGDNAGATEQAFARWTETFAGIKETFYNTIGKVMIEIGEELAPDVKTALESVGDWIRNNKSDIILFFKDLGAVVRALGAAAEIAFAALNLLNNQITSGEASWVERENQLMAETAGSGSGSGQSTLFPGMSSSYAVGTSYVPKTGIYKLHQGEEVRTRSEVRQSPGGATIAPVFNVTIKEAQSPQQTAREVARQILPELTKLNARFAT